MLFYKVVILFGGGVLEHAFMIGGLKIALFFT